MKPNNPDALSPVTPQRPHKYVEHPTYTGKGCAMCGKSKEEHPREEDAK